VVAKCGSRRRQTSARANATNPSTPKARLAQANPNGAGRGLEAARVSAGCEAGGVERQGLDPFSETELARPRRSRV
jgi:hypothetical protein